MNYFGTVLQFGLVKSTNQNNSLITLTIPDIILNFLLKCQSELNISIDVLTQFELEEIRYFYNEEVEELRDFANTVLKSFEIKNINETIDAYIDRCNLTEIDISKDDVSEVFQYLVHLCDIALKGKKILYLLVGFDDTNFIEG
ncbi:hypothetical protein [Gottfriedia luciferensis]|uniref:hypothetical protein n=1 Tax=Gottfriedia luciferensis TaxID=178774 RepID=UPI000B44D725|nr:hypothetical protein [Gottfriedia luciferensis]